MTNKVFTRLLVRKVYNYPPYKFPPGRRPAWWFVLADPRTGTRVAEVRATRNPLAPLGVGAWFRNIQWWLVEGLKMELR